MLSQEKDVVSIVLTERFHMYARIVGERESVLTEERELAAKTVEELGYANRMAETSLVAGILSLETCQGRNVFNGENVVKVNFCQYCNKISI